MEHVKAKHENIRYRCEHCDHVLNSKMALKTHMGTKHATIKPFACGDCGSCFALQSLLTAHMNQKHKTAKKQRLKTIANAENNVVTTVEDDGSGSWKQVVETIAADENAYVVVATQDP